VSAAVTGPAGRRAALHTAVLDWAPVGWRDLPWRRTRDPWAVVVSEVMLQQTQVARVVARWEGWVARWPTPAALAAEPPAEVVRAWAGLGYNRRALNLHRLAVAVVDGHGGALPDDLDGLLALPGIGPYTARAVLVFAFGQPVGVLDTNVARVLARGVVGRPLRRAEAQAEADALVPAGRAWEWNQAVLDLGARCCTARRPACSECPLGRVGGPGCAWRSGSGPDPAPGSAGVSGRQSRFAGSDRQGRGRLLDALRRGPVPAGPGPLAEACGWPDQPDRAERVVAGLAAEGFVVVEGTVLRLA